MSYSPYQEPKMHWFAQLLMNCIISFLLAGCIYAVGVGVLHMNWTAAVFWALFVICLLACYGIWLMFMRKKDGGDGDNDNPSWVSSIID